MRWKALMGGPMHSPCFPWAHDSASQLCTHSHLQRAKATGMAPVLVEPPSPSGNHRSASVLGSRFLAIALGGACPTACFGGARIPRSGMGPPNLPKTDHLCQKIGCFSGLGRQRPNRGPHSMHCACIVHPQLGHAVASTSVWAARFTQACMQGRPVVYAPAVCCTHARLLYACSSEWGAPAEALTGGTLEGFTLPGGFLALGKSVPQCGHQHL